MRILLKQKDGNTKEFQFEKGPILIGRGQNSNIFLAGQSSFKATCGNSILQTTVNGSSRTLILQAKPILMTRQFTKRK